MIQQIIQYTIFVNTLEPLSKSFFILFVWWTKPIKKSINLIEHPNQNSFLLLSCTDNDILLNILIFAANFRFDNWTLSSLLLSPWLPTFRFTHNFPILMLICICLNEHLSNQNIQYFEFVHFPCFLFSFSLKSVSSTLFLFLSLCVFFSFFLF